MFSFSSRQIFEWCGSVVAERLTTWHWCCLCLYRDSSDSTTYATTTWMKWIKWPDIATHSSTGNVSHAVLMPLYHSLSVFVPLCMRLCTSEILLYRSCMVDVTSEYCIWNYVLKKRSQCLWCPTVWETLFLNYLFSQFYLFHFRILSVLRFFQPYVKLNWWSSLLDVIVWSCAVMFRRRSATETVESPWQQTTFIISSSYYYATSVTATSETTPTPIITSHQCHLSSAAGCWCWQWWWRW